VTPDLPPPSPAVPSPVLRLAGLASLVAGGALLMLGLALYFEMDQRSCLVIFAIGLPLIAGGVVLDGERPGSVAGFFWNVV
jgi:hypothetical protein